MFGKTLLITMSETWSGSEVVGVHVEEAVSFHPDEVSKRGDDSDEGHAEQMWDRQSLRDPSAGGLSTLQQKNRSMRRQASRLDYRTRTSEAFITGFRGYS